MNLHLTRYSFVFFILAAGISATLHSAEPAYTFKRGLNIDHWLSQDSGSSDYGGSWFGKTDIDWIAAQGFDHIRLPVDVRHCFASDGSLDEAKLKPIHDVIAWCKSRGLGVVLDAHLLPGKGDKSFGSDSHDYTDFAAIKNAATAWRKLAQRFAGEGDYLRFEIINEPVAKEGSQVNAFMRDMLRAIRVSNPTRIVYVTSNRWSQFRTVSDVVLPDDPHIALALHFYSPVIFTYQRAAFMGIDATLPPVTFPGVVPELEGHVSPDRHEFGKTGDKLTVAQIAESFEKVEAWVRQHRPGMEVYVSEFGVYHAADAASQRNWIATIVNECKKRNWGWAVWCYTGAFAVRRADGTGTPVLDGLFKAQAP
jgi:endoglucanase